MIPPTPPARARLVAPLRSHWKLTAASVTVALAAAAVPVAAQQSPVEDAEATPACSVVQLTSDATRNVSATREAVSADGRKVVYSTWLYGGGHPEWRSSLFDAATGVTTALVTPDGHGVAPVVSADGSTVAFAPDTSPGQPANLYTYDVDQHTYTSRTDAQGDFASNTPKSISADGTRILYLNQQDPWQNPFGLHVLDTATGTTYDVIDEIGWNARFSRAAISPDGTRVAFVSSTDPVGANSDRNHEVFLYNLATGHTRQITRTSDPNVSGELTNFDPQFVDGGAAIVFDSKAAITGSVDGHDLHRLYRYDIAARRFTRLPQRGDRQQLDVIAANGTSAFMAVNDPTGTNPDRNYELFVHDPRSHTTTQITDTTGATFNSPQAIAPTGRAVLFIRGNDNDNTETDNELFLATTCRPAPRPDAAIAPTPSGPFVGDGIYSSIPRTSQQLTRTVADGASATFAARIQNDRNATDTLTIAGIDAGPAGYDVNYRHAGNDITAAVQAGSYTTGPLAPGASTTIKITIHAQPGAGPSHRVDLTATSATNPVARDTVRAKVTRG